MYTNLAPVVPEFYNYVDAFDQPNLEQHNGNLLIRTVCLKFFFLIGT